MIKNVLFGIFVVLFLFFAFKYFTQAKNVTTFDESSALIEKQIKNVGKLVVTEGHFSEVFNYKNSKEIFGRYFTSEKKALVVVNADVSIAYDLSQLTFEIDRENKILHILSIPESEMKISPDFEYYDVQDDFLNQFEASDYNEIKDKVNKILQTKIEASELEANAKDRLLTELTKFYILTNSLGWTLQYDENIVTDLNLLKDFAF